MAAVAANRTIKLTIAYDGSGYHGFQRQLNAMTVQQMLEDKLALLFGHRLILHGAARTDAGVHAYGQVASFRTTGSIPTERIPHAAKGLLPSDVVILSAEDVSDDFHARIAAVSKRYVYRIHNSPNADPCLRHYTWHVPQELCVPAMHTAAQALVGTHDFSAFRAAGSSAVSPVRTLYDIAVTRREELVELTIRGNGFLYHMVRNIMGTLAEIGTGRRPGEGLTAILESRNRVLAGATAPPQGLYLMAVHYPDTPGSVGTKF